MQSSGEGWRYQSPEATGAMCASGAGAGIRSGVSTSRNPFWAKHRRKAWKTSARSWSVARLPGSFQSRSTVNP
jgi:hypothetical protein